MNQIFTWKVWTIILTFTLIILYLFWGGNRDYEIEGLRFLDPVHDDREDAAYMRYYGHIPPPAAPHHVHPIPLRRARTPPPPPYIEPQPPAEAAPPAPVVNVISAPIFNISYGSKGEEYTCRALGELLQAEIINGARLEELTNPATGRKLEIDCWCPTYRIGAEYDGEQHRKFVPRFQRNYSEFIRQVTNDRTKDALCKQNGIKLIRVSDTVDTHHFLPHMGLRPNKNFTAIERYTRIKDYLSHHLPHIHAHDMYNPAPHYTTSYVV